MVDALSAPQGLAWYRAGRKNLTMARLRSLSSFDDEEAQWYFAGGFHSNEKYVFDIDKGFPNVIYIHCDHLQNYSLYGNGKNDCLKIAIRKFINANFVFDVLYRVIDKRYHYSRSEHSYSPSWDDISTIDHGYYAFYFENEAEALLFHMNFSEFTATQMATQHPDRAVDETMLCTRYGTWIFPRD
jgi:hypothetical protein